MKVSVPELKLFLDEGVPRSVGHCFEEKGHTVIYFEDAAAPGSPDPLVATISMENDAVLVALDGDMRKLAQQHGVGRMRYKRLSLIKLSCPETEAASRVDQVMSLIEHEWALEPSQTERRMFIEIGTRVIRIYR